MRSLILLFPVLLAACSTKPAPKYDAYGNPIPEPFEIVKGEPGYTDVARFLGGRPVRSGADLSRLQQSPSYQAYSQEILTKWRIRAVKRVASQNWWQDFYIKPHIGSPRTIIYPFGGPDLLYAASVFPNSSRYILFGLEPVGAIPDLGNTQAVISALPGHERSLESQLLFGYFITKDMKKDFSNGPLQGVLPVLLSTLGLMEAEISEIKSINAGGNPGMEIDFKLPGRGRKSMVYVSGDVSNRGFPGAYESWLTSEANGSVAYFKAASYLMQDGSFTKVRNWVLSRCRGVVQDDSGIPYKAFDQQAWDIHLFGEYTSPIPFFSKHKQPDLASAYAAAGDVPSIPFGSGYQMKPSASNLMVATRK